MDNSVKRTIQGEGDTPGKPRPKKQHSEESRPYKQSRKSLFGKDVVEEASGPAFTCTYNLAWSSDEDAALVQYICLYWPNAHTNQWPCGKNQDFWNDCAEAVNKMCHGRRTGSSCRTRVNKRLSKMYKTIDKAEDALNIDYITNDEGQAQCTPATPPCNASLDSTLSPMFGCSPRKPSVAQSVGDTVKDLVDAFKTKMNKRMKMQLLQYLLKLIVIESSGLDFFKFVGRNFLESSLDAMGTLFEEGKHNLIHGLCECFTRESSKSQTRMPMDRMPFGLLDYNIRFFACKYVQKLGMEEHYALWTETMFSHFGHKWMALHRGPAWQYEVEDKESAPCATEVTVQSRLLEEALMLSGISLSDNESCADELRQPIESIEDEEALMLSGISLSDNESCADELRQPIESIEDDTEEQLLNAKVPSLWTHVSQSQAREVIEGHTSPKDMENYHGITPVSTQRKNKNPGIYDPTKSKMNVATLSVRQIQKRISLSGFTHAVDVQMESLKQAKENNPNGRWWVKADACDVRKGLRQSMRGDWSGDADLGSGDLQVLYKEYQSRCMLVKQIAEGRRNEVLVQDLKKLKEQLEGDLLFLQEGEIKARKLYEKALEGSRRPEAVLMELSWDLTGYDELVNQGKSFLNKLAMVLKSPKEMVWNSICPLQSLQSYLQGLYSKKRFAASHLLIFMISDECRNQKPYAVPVRFMSYRSITDAKMRELELEVEDAMKSLGMVVVGFSTDGEFNSLRTMGEKRAISVVELVKNARSQAKSMKAASISRHFTLDVHGNCLDPHPAVPVEDLRWLDDFMKNGDVPLHAALHIMRRRLFPFAYDPYGWVVGRSETTSEIMKSLMAIYLYRMEVAQLKCIVNDPADFTKHLYQPEQDKDTSEFVHHREDHNHLLKRITNCLREGLIPGIDLRFLVDALHDPNTGLTYEALSGKNKQSVPDCETMFSPGVINFLEQQGHASGARVMLIIHNWHKAVDGRGLSEQQRTNYLMDMKNWLLDDWIPWHREIHNYQLIDVNRPLKGVCGLTREIVVGLVANIESREIRAKEYVSRGLPPEHPRASSTDDVEGLISLLHEMLGPIFDLKQFYSEQPKILNEFKKRVDPELPFFYWTGAKVRYRDFDMPNFNQPTGPGVVERLDRIKLSRRGDPGVFVANRASLPQRGQLTVRAQFHRAPIALPPVP